MFQKFHKGGTGEPEEPVAEKVEVNKDNEGNGYMEIGAGDGAEVPAVDTANLGADEVNTDVDAGAGAEDDSDEVNTDVDAGAVAEVAEVAEVAGDGVAGDGVAEVAEGAEVPGDGAEVPGDGVADIAKKAANALKGIFSATQVPQNGGAKRTQKGGNDTNDSIAKELNSIIRKVYAEGSGLKPEEIKTELCKLLQELPEIKDLVLPQECNTTTLRNQTLRQVSNYTASTEKVDTGYKDIAANPNIQATPMRPTLYNTNKKQEVINPDYLTVDDQNQQNVKLYNAVNQEGIPSGTLKNREVPVKKTPNNKASTLRKDNNNVNETPKTKTSNGGSKKSKKTKRGGSSKKRKTLKKSRK